MTLRQTLTNANKTLSSADELIAELLDGVTLVVVHEGDKPLWLEIAEFLKGERKELPLKIRLDVKED